MAPSAAHVVTCTEKRSTHETGVERLAAPTNKSLCTDRGRGSAGSNRDVQEPSALYSVVLHRPLKPLTWRSDDQILCYLVHLRHRHVAVTELISTAACAVRQMPLHFPAQPCTPRTRDRQLCPCLRSATPQQNPPTCSHSRPTSTHTVAHRTSAMPPSSPSTTSSLICAICLRPRTA